MNRAPSLFLSFVTKSKPNHTRLGFPSLWCGCSVRWIGGPKPSSKPTTTFVISNYYHSIPKCFRPALYETVIFGRNVTRIRHNLLVGRLCSSQGHSPKKVKALTTATYISFFIGACMLTAVAFRFYTKAKYRARGMEVITDRDFSTRTPFFKYRGYTLPMLMANSLDKIYHFEVRDDDVWIVTFPKAGTTWMQEIVYLVLSDLDFAGALSKTVDERAPYFEFIYPGLSTIAKLPSPRIIKTHLPPSLLPRQMAEKKPKIIYIARNPKDTVVSYFHFVKLFNALRFNGDFELFFNKFMADNLAYCPWWRHVKEGWETRHQDNVLFLTYEDMKKDPAAVVHRVAEFLGKPLPEAEVSRIVEHTSFARMKANDMTNYSWFKGTIFQEGEGQFFRKGVVGDWKNALTDKMAQRVETLVTMHLRPLGLTFEDEPSSEEGQQAYLPASEP